MGFTEEIFLFVFMPLSIIVYLLVAQCKRYQLNNVVLVGISMVFYAWSSLDTMFLFVLINVFVYLMGYLAFSLSRKTASDENSKNGKVCIAVAIIVLLAFLIYYKYVPFIVQTINSIATLNLSLKTLIVPIGLSFVTFEAISYIVDIYRGDAEPGSLLDTFTFLSLFPKIVSGPIVLWKDFKPQLPCRQVSLDGVSQGINRIIIGFAKKAIIADTFGTQILAIDNAIGTVGADLPTMWLRAIMYFFELYYDFSGYSDIAIGLCNIFGFHIKENFNFPYISKSISEFWRRWHISLGSWFREYVYIPLGGNRRGNVYVNLFIVFLLTGIWHGANWTFVVWGIIHGIFVVLERYVKDKPWYIKTPGVIKWVVTMVVIFFAWIIFMSPSLMEAGKTIAALFISQESVVYNFTWQYYLTPKIIILLVIAAFGAFVGAAPFVKKIHGTTKHQAVNLVQRVILMILLVVDVLFIVNSSYSPFIYFQF